MEPKYMHIYKKMKERILNNEFKDTNHQLPNELTLCKEFNCSRMTIKKALDMLVLDGMIYRKKGKGSFVLPSNSSSSKINILEDRILGLSSLTDKKITSKILRFQLIFADKNIADKLQIKEQDPVYDISRLRFIDGKPCVLEQTYMNPILIPGINEDILNHSIYDYIQTNLEMKIAGSLRVSRADCSNKNDQKYLELLETEPVLEVEQVAYLDNGNPFEYSFSRHRYDCFEFFSRFIRHN